MYASYFYLSFFFIVVGIPVLAGVYKRHLRYKEKQLEILGSQAARDATQSAAQTRLLEQRVRVLERIATDRGIDVADEIERLRDQPVN
jgi:hypothetical protein